MPKLEAYYCVMRNAVLADTKKPWTNEQFEQGVQGMRGVIAARQPDIQSPDPVGAAISPRPRARRRAPACARCAALARPGAAPWRRR